MSTRPVIGLPRVAPAPRIVFQPELYRQPVKHCNTCRFERTPPKDSPCDSCVDIPHPSQWRPK